MVSILQYLLCNNRVFVPVCALMALISCRSQSYSDVKVFESQEVSADEKNFIIPIVSVLKNDKICRGNEVRFQPCTASRVNANQIITAAHCVKEPDQQVFVVQNSNTYFQKYNSMFKDTYAPCAEPKFLEDIKAVSKEVSREAIRIDEERDIALINVLVTNPIVETAATSKGSKFFLFGAGRTTCVKNGELSPFSKYEIGFGKAELKYYQEGIDNDTPWLIPTKITSRRVFPFSSQLNGVPCGGDSGSLVAIKQGSEYQRVGVYVKATSDFTLDGTINFFSEYNGSTRLNTKNPL